jgi:delta 1-pyrroline-5-carboxylate dehydrogenase
VRVELAEASCLSGSSKAEASREVAAAIERVVHYAGWTDKYEQVLGSVNPVASAHFNFTVTEPMGIVGILAPDDAPVLGLLSLILPAITSGNSVVALASTTQPYPSILLGEMLATSDLPGGVVNLLTGVRERIDPHVCHARASAGHQRRFGCGRTQSAPSASGAAESVKRVRLLKAEEPIDWFADKMQGAEEIRALVEFKTTWHPVGA